MRLTSALMLSALMAGSANAWDEKLIPQRMLMMMSSNDDNQNNANYHHPSARQLVDQIRQNKKSINVDMTGTPLFHDDDHQKNVVWNPSERRMEVVIIPKDETTRSLRVVNQNKNKNKNNNHVINQQRMAQQMLPMTGHIWDACIPDSTPTNEEVTQKTFENTLYDDQLNPYCGCIYDASLDELWLQCRMGDEQCDPTADDIFDDNSCEETNEIFIFSQNTGDLAIKNTCNFCTDFSYQNCTNIREICSVVFFDDNETPEQCFFQELFEDRKPERCENCQICKDGNAMGMMYDCFGKSTEGACDTSVSFHVHNFAPVTTSGPSPVGGRFGDVCRKNEEFALYDKTSYDDDYSKVCDCDDPTAGVIVCDLFIKADFCFANECSPISEIFYFSETSGELNKKLTCDATNGLCSTVGFTENDGKPSTCEVMLFPDPQPCTSCNICQDENTKEYGIQFSCFGSDQTTCLTTNGRAVNNFVDQPTSPPVADATEPPVDGTEPPTPNEGGGGGGGGGGPKKTQGPDGLPLADEGSTPWGPIIGAFVGGLFLAGILAFVCSRKKRTDVVEDTNPEPPVDEAHQDEIDETEPKEVPALT